MRYSKPSRNHCRRADTSMPIAVMAHMITRKATPTNVTQKSEFARPLAPMSRKK